MGTGSQHTLILIADDSPDDLNMFAHFLVQKGYRVTKALDGKEALEKASALRPQLILMDLWLPVVSGWVAVQRLKANASTRDIPVLVVTGHDFVRLRECAGWLVKPCPLDKLNAEVRRILNAQAEGEEPPPS